MNRLQTFPSFFPQLRIPPRVALLRGPHDRPHYNILIILGLVDGVVRQASNKRERERESNNPVSLVHFQLQVSYPTPTVLFFSSIRTVEISPS